MPTLSNSAKSPEKQVETVPQTVSPATVISGKKMVMVMFLFGSVVTAFLFYYWTMHTARFRPLQDAIAIQYKGSMPRVEGGQRKKHLELSPMILRVTMKVKFDPTTHVDTAEDFAAELTTFIQKHENIQQFDKIEYYFYQPNPEKTIKQQRYTYETKLKNKSASESTF